MSTGRWRDAARAAGFDVEALSTVADFVALGAVAVDGPPIETLPGYWLIPGFAPYDGHIILAAVDRRRSPSARSGEDLATIVAQAVDDGRAAVSADRGEAPWRKLGPP